MREVKFRGRRLDTGDWMYGDYVRRLISGVLLHNITNPNMYDLIPVDPKTVQQYTGLKDRNGKDIYDGIKVKAVYRESEGGGWYSDHKVEGKVYFDTHWGVKFDCRDGTQRIAEHWGKMSHTDFHKVEIMDECPT